MKKTYVVEIECDNDPENEGSGAPFPTPDTFAKFVRELTSDWLDGESILVTNVTAHERKSLRDI